ncbi:5-deoxy-glucuronate isomerase [Tessaracoccus sp. Y1736]
MTDHVLPAGSTGRPPLAVDVSPESANWAYSGLKVAVLAAGESYAFGTGESECLVLPLEGAATVTVGGETHTLDGRSTIFGEVTDYLYLPRGAEATLTSVDGGRYALPSAVASETLDVRYCPAEEATVGLRGAGTMSRQVTNYALNNTLQTSRLLVCEVITPGGNWSSYPPHKHDETTENERELEEIYYFEIKADEHGPGMAFHSTYGTPERPIDVALRVNTGDTALVPHGWHGPCVAAPGYDLYYLNVMAGPGGPEWLSVDDPCYGWLRQTWDDTDVDHRLPYAPTRLDA